MPDLPQIPKAWILPLAAIVLLLATSSTSFFTIPAESEGVVIRFGRYLKTVQPGLHFKWPLGTDTVEVLPTRRQLKMEFGFATQGNTNPYQSGSESERERVMVTGDLNAAIVEWIIQYRIQDPKKYLFDVRDPAATLRDLSEAAMREVVGDRTVDEVITIGRQDIETVALARLRSLVDLYEIGVIIDQVQLKNVNPPPPVQASFHEVNKAQQDRESLINVANGEYNREVPKARGEAESALQAAEGYALKRVNEAEGDVASFAAMLEQYTKAPEITKTRIYLETMGEVIPKAGPKIVVDESLKQWLPLLSQTSKVGGQNP
jgi:membrane protease subunit HflK